MSKKRNISRKLEGGSPEMALWGSAVQVRYAPPFSNDSRDSEVCVNTEEFRFVPAVIETADGLTIVRKAVPVLAKKCEKSVISRSSKKGAA